MLTLQLDGEDLYSIDPNRGLVLWADAESILEEIGIPCLPFSKGPGKHIKVVEGLVAIITAWGSSKVRPRV